MGRLRRLLANQTTHKQFWTQLFLLIEDYFPGQCPGEHIGAGAPPSANDEVDIAPSNTSVASIRRAIFFMIKISQGIALPRSRTTIFFRDGGKLKCSKNARRNLFFVGIPTAS